MNLDFEQPTQTFKRKVSYLYHPDIGDFHYGEKHYMKPARVKMTHSLITAYGLQDHIEMLTPRSATFREMSKFHCTNYLDFLRRVTPEDSAEILKYQAQFNVGDYCPDCPVFEGVYEFCSISAGGSIVAAKRINQGAADIAINWGGGLHHAKRSEASGFCYVNDIVLSIIELLKYYQRVLYIDTDVHHGDGVEEAFYSSNRVMCVSLHKFGEFFPGTGALNDIGVGKGKNYSANVPLNDGIDDESYKFIFNSIIEYVMNWFRPGAVVLQLGADSLVGDRLGAFNLSMRGHAQSVSFLKKFNVPFLMVGGGGYTIGNVARVWCYETSVAAGVELPEDLPYHEYFEYYCPNYLLDVTASNMENLNTREYLEKIRMVIIENLRNVEHAPSVAQHPVPVEYCSSSYDDETLDDDFSDRCSYTLCSNNSSDDDRNMDFSTHDEQKSHPRHRDQGSTVKLMTKGVNNMELYKNLTDNSPWTPPQDNFKNQPESTHYRPKMTLAPTETEATQIKIKEEPLSNIEGIRIKNLTKLSSPNSEISSVSQKSQFQFGSKVSNDTYSDDPSSQNKPSLPVKEPPREKRQPSAAGSASDITVQRKSVKIAKPTSED